jgi:hypothetical protein
VTTHAKLCQPPATSLGGNAGDDSDASGMSDAEVHDSEDDDDDNDLDDEVRL